MISSRSPTASRTAATTPIPSSARSGAIRILTARKPSSTQRQSVLGTLAGRAQLAPGRVRRQLAARAPQQRRHRLAAGLAEQIPQRRLERPVAPRVERDRLERPRMSGNGERVPPHEQLKQNHQSRPSCRRCRLPTSPSSVSTRTIVASNDRRGSGSQAA